MSGLLPYYLPAIHPRGFASGMNNGESNYRAALAARQFIYPPEYLAGNQTTAPLWPRGSLYLNRIQI